MIGKIKIAATTVEKITSLKNSFIQSRRDRNDEYDLALTSLLAAICETKLYVAVSERSGKADLEREALIAHLWHKAAVAMRRFNADLAQRLYLKGSYWTEPSSWTDTDVKNNKISLDEMHEVCRQLLWDKK